MLPSRFRPLQTAGPRPKIDSHPHQVKEPKTPMHPPRTFDALVAIMERLRDPGGCPWDREQTYATLRGFLLEEAYEVAEAIDDGDPDHLREELGDLLFQVVFLSKLAKEEGRFDA